MNAYIHSEKSFAKRREAFVKKKKSYNSSNIIITILPNRITKFKVYVILSHAKVFANDFRAC